jgi:hypothetical protein
VESSVFSSVEVTPRWVLHGLSLSLLPYIYEIIFFNLFVPI